MCSLGDLWVCSECASNSSWLTVLKDDLLTTEGWWQFWWLLVAVSQTRRAINTSLLAANYGTTWHSTQAHKPSMAEQHKHNTAEQHKHWGKKPHKLPCLQSGLQCSDTAPLIVDFVFRHQPPFHYSRGPPNISLHRRPGGKPFLIHLLARTWWCNKRPEQGWWVEGGCEQCRGMQPVLLSNFSLNYIFVLQKRTSQGSEKSPSLHN